jgi:hypothetical protein
MIRWLTVCKWHRNVLSEKRASATKSNRTKIYSPCSSAFFTLLLRFARVICVLLQEAETVKQRLSLHTCPVSTIYCCNLLPNILCLQKADTVYLTFSKNMYVQLSRRMQMRQCGIQKIIQKTLASHKAYIMPMFPSNQFAF